MITRLTERFKWTHVWWGRIFMLGYYYASWTSILIYKQGLPRAILVFMTIMFNALAIGWLAIKFHSGGNMEEQGRDWKQRLFSLKALHGVCMFIAWYQMAGRAFVTNPFHQYQCDTIPVYKNDPNRMPIQQDDPDMYGGTPKRCSSLELSLLALSWQLLGPWVVRVGLRGELASKCGKTLFSNCTMAPASLTWPAQAALLRWPRKEMARF
eukprot:g48493.t1